MVTVKTLLQELDLSRLGSRQVLDLVNTKLLRHGEWHFELTGSVELSRAETSRIGSS